MFMSAGVSLVVGLAVGGAVWNLIGRGDVLRIARRRNVVRNDLPDFLDLLSMGLSAGLSLERAWMLGAHHLGIGAFKEELETSFFRESSQKPFESALEEFVRRQENEEMESLLTLLLQANKRGAPVERFLVETAENLRRRRLSALERRAGTAAVRLLLPLVFFIFPSLFLILLGPLVLSYLARGGLF